MPVGGFVYWARFAPTHVVAHRLERGPVVAEVMGTGTLEAHFKAAISPKIPGRIREVLVDQGDRVKAGQVLVKLDDDELKHQVGIAQANLEAAQAARVRSRSERERAGAVERQARRESDRVQSLFARKVSSQEELDKVTEALAVATAGLSSADAAGLEAEQQILAARATLEFQRTRLADAVIAAPSDGLIVERQRDPGEVVVPGSSLLSMIVTDELSVRAWVDETEMARLRTGQPARVVFRSEPERSYPGTVARLGRQADRETREFIVDVRVLELPVNWSVGQRAEVFIETARNPDALRLPSGFLVRDGAKTGVYVNRNGAAAWHPVRIGLRGRDVLEVQSGLDAAMTVVRPVVPQGKLAAGRKVATP
jgi:HlyD family secretion protein